MHHLVASTPRRRRPRALQAAQQALVAWAAQAWVPALAHAGRCHHQKPLEAQGRLAAPARAARAEVLASAALAELLAMGSSSWPAAAAAPLARPAVVAALSWSCQQC
jgi:hypothetical protein